MMASRREGDRGVNSSLPGVLRVALDDGRMVHVRRRNVVALTDEEEEVCTTSQNINNVYSLSLSVSVSVCLSLSIYFSIFSELLSGLLPNC